MTAARNIWAAALLIAAGCAPAARHGPAAADLLADVKSIAPGQPFTVAVSLKPDRGWHLYWSNPGDSGLAPEVTWDLPPGFTAGEIQRPFPEAIASPPFMTYGHEGEVLYLFTITPPNDLPPGNVTLAANVEWLVCKDACLPGEARLEQVLPVSAGPAQAHGRHAAKIAAARRRLPADPAGWRFAATLENGRYRVIATSPGATAIASAFFFPYEPNVIRHAAPQTWRREDARYILELEPAQPSASPPAQLAGVLVTKGSWLAGDPVRAIRIEAPFSGNESQSPNPERNQP